MLENLRLELEVNESSFKVDSEDVINLTENNSVNEKAAIKETNAETVHNHDAPQNEKIVCDTELQVPEDQISYAKFFQGLELWQSNLLGITRLRLDPKIEDKIRWLRDNLTSYEIKSFHQYATADPEQTALRLDPVTISSLTKEIAEWRASLVTEKSFSKEELSLIKKCGECDAHGMKKTSINGHE